MEINKRPDFKTDKPVSMIFLDNLATTKDRAYGWSEIALAISGTAIAKAIALLQTIFQTLASSFV